MYMNNYILRIFMPPPLEQGGVLFCNCRSVGRYVGLSVCRPSVVRSISFDPFSIPNLAQGLTQWVDDPYWFSGHMFKGQSQTTLLSPLCCPLHIFWTLHLINNKFYAELRQISIWSLLIFRSHVQMSRLNHSSQSTVFSAQYLLTPSLDQYQTWCRGCPQ